MGKELQLQDAQDADDQSFESLISGAMMFYDKAGFNPEDMRLRFRVLDQLDAAAANGRVLKLEDADFEFLRRSFAVTRWLSLHRNVPALTVALDEAAKPKE